MGRLLLNPANVLPEPGAGLKHVREPASDQQHQLLPAQLPCLDAVAVEPAAGEWAEA